MADKNTMTEEARSTLAMILSNSLSRFILPKEALSEVSALPRGDLECAAEEARHMRLACGARIQATEAASKTTCAYKPRGRRLELVSPSGDSIVTIVHDGIETCYRGYKWSDHEDHSLATLTDLALKESLHIERKEFCALTSVTNLISALLDFVD